MLTFFPPPPAYAVLGDPRKRESYERSLRADPLPIVPYSGRSSSSSYMPPLEPRHHAHSRRQSPPDVGDPFSLFEAILAQHQQAMNGGGGGGGGGGRNEDGSRWDGHYNSRVGVRDLADRLGQQLHMDDPLRFNPHEFLPLDRERDRAPRSASRDRFRGADPLDFDWAAGPPAQYFGDDPWGRKVDMDLSSSWSKGDQRQRKMSGSMVEGEKHRNGDWKVSWKKYFLPPTRWNCGLIFLTFATIGVQVRSSKHSVEQAPDGSIRFSSVSIESSFYSVSSVLPACPSIQWLSQSSHSDFSSRVHPVPSPTPLHTAQISPPAVPASLNPRLSLRRYPAIQKTATETESTPLPSLARSLPSSKRPKTVSAPLPVTPSLFPLLAFRGD